MNPRGLTRALKHLGLSCTIAPHVIGDEKTVGITIHGAGSMAHAGLTAMEARAIAALLYEHASYIDPRAVADDMQALSDHLDPPPPPAPASGFDFGSVYDPSAGSAVASVYDRPAK